MKTNDQKSIFDYENYRTYLNDYFNLRQKQNPQFSHRDFAKIVGAKNPSFLISIVSGKANLSPKTIEKVASALELKTDEAYFFRNLVLLNQSTSIEEQQIYSQLILKSRGFRQSHPQAMSTFQYLTHWYYAAIHELTNLPDFCEDPAWISQRLSGKVTPAEIKKALSELVDLGVLKRDSKGKLTSAENVVVSPDEVTSTFVARYHEEFLKLAITSIKEDSRDVRDISGTTFSISRESLKKIKEILQRFRREIVGIVAQEKNPEGLYQLNMQLFPLAPFEVEDVTRGEIKKET